MANPNRDEVKAVALLAARNTAGRLANKSAAEKSYAVWRAALDAAAEASRAAGSAFGEQEIHQIADEVESVPNLAKIEPVPMSAPDPVDIASRREVRRWFKSWGVSIQALAAAVQTVLLGFTLAVYRRQADISDVQTKIQQTANDVAYHVDLSRLRNATKAIVDLCESIQGNRTAATTYSERLKWLKSVSDLLDGELTNPALIRNTAYFETWKDACGQVDITNNWLTGVGEPEPGSSEDADQTRMFVDAHQGVFKRMMAVEIAFHFFRSTKAAPGIDTLPKPDPWD